MPRGPRLDCPGAVHHVILRGIERRDIFRSDTDRTDLLTRIGRVLPESRMEIYAWALMSIHLLVRTGPVPLSTVVGRIFSAYALAFNRRYDRSGHLFQNRFKSILVDEKAYLLRLLRYIHLNPLRARLLREFGELENYPWAGHATLLGHADRPWQCVEPILRRFGRTPRDARRAYRLFVLAGVDQDQRSELRGSGVRHRAVSGGWEPLPLLRRGREQWAWSERILGSAEFVQHVLADIAASPESHARTRADPSVLDALLDTLSAKHRVSTAEIASRTLRRSAVSARAEFCHHAVRRHGWSLTAVARYLGVSRTSVHRGVQAAEKGHTRERPNPEPGHID